MMGGEFLARSLHPRPAVVAEVAAWLAASVLYPPPGHNNGWIAVLGRNGSLEWLTRPQGATQAEVSMATSVLGNNHLGTVN